MQGFSAGLQYGVGTHLMFVSKCYIVKFEHGKNIIRSEHLFMIKITNYQVKNFQILAVQPATCDDIFNGICLTYEITVAMSCVNLVP